MTDKDTQADEILAMSMMYPDQWRRLEGGDSSYSVTIKHHTQPNRRIYVEFQLPTNYPSVQPPAFSFRNSELSIEQRRLISVELNKLWAEMQGGPVLFSWVDKIREMVNQLQDNVSNSRITDVVQSRRVNLPVKDNKEDNELNIDIYTSDTHVDRGSKFIAHVATVRSVSQVEKVKNYIMKNKKISAATHNVLAYRITNENGKGIDEHYDDDGESQAGGRILHMMNLANAIDVMVIVTRWYGGVNLGSTRFRHYNNVAKLALEHTGHIRTKKNSADQAKGKKR